MQLVQCAVPEISALWLQEVAKKQHLAQRQHQTMLAPLPLVDIIVPIASLKMTDFDKESIESFELRTGRKTYRFANRRNLP